MIARTLLPIAALALSGPALADEYHGDSDQRFEGAGQQTELDCDGGSISIEGASNILLIGGGCTALTIEGAGNQVVVDMAPGGRIAVEGASNRVRWTSPAGTRVSVRSQGADNQVIRSK